MPELYFEDFTAGQPIPTVSGRVDAAEARAFAEAFDPQPFHLDTAAAQASPLQGPAVSGWFTAALGMRLICESFLLRTASLGSPGVEEVKWRRPVRPGDVLTLSGQIADVRSSRSRPDLGILTVALTLSNTAGEIVMTQKATIFVGRQPQDERP